MDYDFLSIRLILKAIYALINRGYSIFLLTGLRIYTGEHKA